MEHACKQTFRLETNDAYLKLIPPHLTPKIFSPRMVSDLNWSNKCHIVLSTKKNDLYRSAWSSKVRNNSFAF